MRRALAVAALLGASACAGAPPRCATPDASLADGLTCADAEAAVRWAEVLAGRSLTGPQRGLVWDGLVTRQATHPDDVRADLAGASAAVGALAAAGPVLAQAEARSRAVWDATHGGGPLPTSRYPDVVKAVAEAAAVWATDPDAHLSLTEMDVEGWIRYASLCREVQGAGPLTLSVAGRVDAYRAVVARWESGSREDRVALVAVGPYWLDVQAQWAGASYERQQAWITAAPLPPATTATSPEYLRHLLTTTSLVGHATALHARLGPLRMWVPQP